MCNWTKEIFYGSNSQTPTDHLVVKGLRRRRTRLPLLSVDAAAAVPVAAAAVGSTKDRLLLRGAARKPKQRERENSSSISVSLRRRRIRNRLHCFSTLSWIEGAEEEEEKRMHSRPAAGDNGAKLSGRQKERCHCKKISHHIYVALANITASVKVKFPSWQNVAKVAS